MAERREESAARGWGEPRTLMQGPQPITTLHGIDSGGAQGRLVLVRVLAVQPEVWGLGAE